jgi:hypothetical protein
MVADRTKTPPDYVSARRKSATTIELAGPSRRLTGRDFMRGDIQMYVHNTSRRRGSSAFAVVGSCLGVYVVLAMAFHWCVEPSVAKSRAVAPYQPPPAAMMQAAAPVARSAPPARLAARQRRRPPTPRRRRTCPPMRHRKSRRGSRRRATSYQQESGILSVPRMDGDDRDRALIPA